MSEGKKVKRILDRMKLNLEDATVQEKACGEIMNLAAEGADKVKMLSMGAGERIVEAMQAHKSNDDLQEKACGALGNLAKKRDNQAKLMSIGGGERILEAMQVHRINANLLERACDTLGSLAENSDNRKKLMIMGAEYCILNAMRGQKSNARVQEKACGALWSLSGNNEGGVEQISIGAAEHILQAMKVHKASSGVQEEASGALINLTVNRMNQTTLMSMGIGECIVDVMKAHASNVNVQINSCSALANLAVNRENHGKLISVGSGESIVEAMRAYKSNVTMQESACAALLNLALSSENQVELMRIGAGEHIVKAMEQHKSNLETQISACGALRNLAENTENEVELMRLGAGERILEALQVHKCNADLVEKCCSALWNLSVDRENEVELMSMGAGERIVEAMEAHKSNANIQICAFGALRNLATNEETKVKWICIGAGEHIVEAMQAHKANATIQQNACGALWSLVENSPDNQVKLMTMGAAERIVEAMQEHKLNVNLQQNACGALWCLASNRINHSNLMTMGAAERIVEAMQLHKASPEIQISACNVLKILSMKAKNKLGLMRMGAGKRLLEAMQAHKSNADIQEEACAVLWSLAAKCENRVDLVSFGAGERIVEAMQAHPANANIQRQSCGALKNLAINSANKEKLIGMKAGDSIVQAMLEHKQHAGVQEQACGALFHFAGNIENKLKLMSVGAADRIVEAMQIHKSDAGVQQEASQACRKLNMIVPGGDLQVQDRLTLVQVLAQESQKVSFEKDSCVADRYCRFLKAYSLLRDLRTSTQDDSRNQINATEIEFFDWFEDSLSTTPLQHLCDDRAFMDIQRKKEDLEKLQREVRENTLRCTNNRNLQRSNLVESLRQALKQDVNSPIMSFVDECKKKIPSYQKTIDGSSEGNSEGVSLESVQTLLETWRAERELWKKRHDPGLWKRASEVALSELRKKAAGDDNRETTFESFTELQRLENMSEEIENAYTAIQSEIESLKVDRTLVDYPHEAAGKLMKMVLQFVLEFLPTQLDKMMKQRDMMEKMLTELLKGLIEPRTDHLERLMSDLHDIEGDRAYLEFQLSNAKRQLKRTGGTSNEAETIQMIERDIRALGGVSLSKKIVAERARILKLVDIHYPEKLLDPQYRMRIGLHNLVDSVELTRKGLLLDGITKNDFTVVRDLRANENRKVQVVREPNGSQKVLKTFWLKDSATQQQFVRQCEALSTLEGTNIIRIDGVFIDEQLGCVLMPYYENGDLGRWMEKNPCRSRDRATCKQIACDLLNGVIGIHSGGHVHCDLKPSNIFLTSTYHAVIGDFDGVRMENRTVTSVMCTAKYVAPEIKSGVVQSVSASVDMYSIGLILNELFSFDTDNVDLRSLVDSLQSEDPSERPSAEAVLRGRYLSSRPANVRDCLVCFDKVLEADSMGCNSGHSLCRICANQWVASDLKASSIAPDGSLLCCIGDCHELILSQDAARILGREEWESVLKALSDLEKGKMETKFEERLMMELSKNIDDQKVTMHRNHILNDIMTLHCPRCKKAFVDFDACFAVTCRDESGKGCGCKFCAWCLADCGNNSQAAHQHVVTCSRNRSRGKDALYGNHSLRETEMKRLRSERLNDYWESSVCRESDSVRNQLRKLLPKFFDRLEISLLPAELTESGPGEKRKCNEAPPKGKRTKKK